MTRLLNKNTRYLLLILPVILIICSTAFFFLLLLQVHHLQQEELFLKQANVLNRFKNINLDRAYSIDGEFNIQKISPTSNGLRENVIGDTLMTDLAKRPIHLAPFRKLTTYIDRNHQVYRLTTFVSSEETKHLFIMVFSIQGLIYLILLFTIIFVNRRLSEILWRPFYSTIGELKEYDINHHTSFSPLQDTGIQEFNDLNQVASQLIARNRQAFESQQQFVENASHEIQTPLAIIRSKVELLMEQPAMNGPMAELTLEISKANDRLSRLNNTLLLLAKIDNNQFLEQENICLSTLISSIVANFGRQYGVDFPRLIQEIEPEVYIFANLTLLEILLHNLIRNAILHNIENGYIWVGLSQKRLIIENPGPELNLAPELLFERFRKGNHQKGYSSGLGLALVKQIGNIYQYKISYTFHSPLHRLEVQFKV
ncbi:MAG: sensor histidine kinase [Chitinophagaceae bacterium]